MKILNINHSVCKIPVETAEFSKTNGVGAATILGNLGSTTQGSLRRYLIQK